ISDDIAVMRNGVIVERGTPQDIYLRSDDPFVVDFIGRANFLEAKIKSYQNESRCVVTSPLGDVVCSAPAGLEAGTPVTIYTRPESFTVLQADSGLTENVFEAKVNSVLFAGEAHEVEFAIGDATVLAKIEFDIPLRKGDSVRLHIDPEWCRVLNPKRGSSRA
nr:TOBE domain-containing protein [Bacillota bacterium]